VIIGGGPSGLAAAIQLARQGQSALVLERSRIGGLLWNANLVENYPGFVNGISGPALVELFQEQAEKLGVEVMLEEVQTVEVVGDFFRISTINRSLQARCLVAATGTIPRKYILPGIEDCAPGRIYSEVYPLLGVQDAEIAIIGAGDAAFDYALNLADDNQLTILNRDSDTNALPLLVERAVEHPAIRYLDRTMVNKIAPDDREKLVLNIQTGEQTTVLSVDYLIAAIGREPNTGFASQSIMEDSEELIRQRRLYLIGDLVNGHYRQTAIAVGDGIRAAMEIGEYLGKGDL
jgi:thioredoxin reductase